MAVGDQDDIYRRFIQNLPPWFGTDHLVLDTFLAALIGYNPSLSLITTLYFHYNYQYLYALDQLRIQTAYSDNLDLISLDYLGTTLPRKPEESDGSYRQRILANVVRPRATRPAMSQAIELLTGIEPVIIEGWSLSDHGSYRNLPLAYSAGGSYGSNAPYQAWIYVYIDAYQSMANYSGYSVVAGGYRNFPGISQLYYGSSTLIDKYISESDVFQLIEATKVYGTLIHVTIVQAPQPFPVPPILLDNDGDTVLDNFGDEIFV